LLWGFTAAAGVVVSFAIANGLYSGTLAMIACLFMASVIAAEAFIKRSSRGKLGR
jgi:hypothetical protein